MPLSPPKAPTRIAKLSPPDGEPSLDTLGDTSGDLLKVLSRFQKGVGLSVWQNNGDDNSNWTRHSSTNWPCNLSAATGMQKYEQCPDFLNRYKEDIGLAKKLGCTSFRLSLEWARIEPVRGQFDAVTIQRYHDIFDYLAELGMEPNITLHHFVHPGWFEDLGAFTKDANIPVFVAWAVKAFELFGPRIKMWSTFNEPTCYMFLGFIIGQAPPAHVMDLIGAGRMLLIMLKCHSAAYRAMKALPGGQHTMIGLVSHHITFLPKGSGLIYAPARLAAEWATYWWGWDVVDHWMLTGQFKWKLPLVGDWIVEQDPAGKPPCDWWGVNYYSRCVVSWYLQPTKMAGELMTDMKYPVYSQGLYDAIKRSSKYGIPMYITETGIADAKDTTRGTFIDLYFKARLGCVGFYYWTLIDNFEWSAGYKMKFGLYEWNTDGSNDRVLKEGARPLIGFYETLPDRMTEFRAAARDITGKALLARPKKAGTGALHIDASVSLAVENTPVVQPEGVACTSEVREAHKADQLQADPTYCVRWAVLAPFLQPVPVGGPATAPRGPIPGPSLLKSLEPIWNTLSFAATVGYLAWLHRVAELAAEQCAEDKAAAARKHKALLGIIARLAESLRSEISQATGDAATLKKDLTSLQVDFFSLKTDLASLERTLTKSGKDLREGVAKEFATVKEDMKACVKNVEKMVKRLDAFNEGR
ncbi:MAG: hypothetical protein WDW38_005492 [Sanguina aurantia]